MAKVIVERPRYGSSQRGMGKGYWRRLQRIDIDDLPKRERIKQARTKQFNEHLGPLRRYLRKQVGRSWNKVHGELRTQIGRDSVVNNHVFTHVFQYVAVHVVEIDGQLFEADGYRMEIPLGAWMYPLFYVCPRSGILKQVRRKSRRQRRADRLSPTLHVSVDFETSFVRQEGIWMRVRVEEIPTRVPCDIHGFHLPLPDVLHEAGISRADAVRLYGRAVIAVEARRATRPEIRKFCEPLKAPNLV